jgi:hypothetical protein
VIQNFLRLLRVREKDNIEFWVSHLLIVVSTIVGVFLAAQAGFDKALQFEAIKTDRENYYLQSALAAELEDNLDNVAAWGADFVGGGAQGFKGQAEKYRLETFVWEAMKETPNTFQIPAEILTPIRRYYRDIAADLTAMTALDAQSRAAVDHMLAATEALRAQALPLLQEHLAALGARVEAAGP